MEAILLGVILVLVIYLALTDRYLLNMKRKNEFPRKLNKPQPKPKKKYEVKSKSVTYLPSEPKKEEPLITPKLEEKPKKEVSSTSTPTVNDKKQRGYSRQESELRRLVKDDGAVDRLIIALIDKFPDKSRNWCADKALADWLRDRH